jgi:putative transposase
MMAGKRRVHEAPFKAKVALAAAKGDRTTAQLASQFGIHTSQVTAWKKQLMAQVAGLFADGRQRRAEQAADEQELYEQIGCLKMEVEWLKESCPGQPRSSEVKRPCIEPNHEHLSWSRQPPPSDATPSTGPPTVQPLGSTSAILDHVDESGLNRWGCCSEPEYEAGSMHSGLSFFTSLGNPTSIARAYAVWAVVQPRTRGSKSRSCHRVKPRRLKSDTCRDGVVPLIFPLSILPATEDRRAEYLCSGGTSVIRRSRQ